MLISALLNTVAIAPMGKKSQESVAESTSIPVSLLLRPRHDLRFAGAGLNERFPQWEGGEIKALRGRRYNDLGEKKLS